MVDERGRQSHNFSQKTLSVLYSFGQVIQLAQQLPPEQRPNFVNNFLRPFVQAYHGIGPGQMYTTQQGERHPVKSRRVPDKLTQTAQRTNVIRRGQSVQTEWVARAPQKKPHKPRNHRVFEYRPASPDHQGIVLVDKTPAAQRRAEKAERQRELALVEAQRNTLLQLAEAAKGIIHINPTSIAEASTQQEIQKVQQAIFENIAGSQALPRLNLQQLKDLSQLKAGDLAHTPFAGVIKLAQEKVGLNKFENIQNAIRIVNSSLDQFFYQYPLAKDKDIVSLLETQLQEFLSHLQIPDDAKIPLGFVLPFSLGAAILRNKKRAPVSKDAQKWLFRAILGILLLGSPVAASAIEIANQIASHYEPGASPDGDESTATPTPTEPGLSPTPSASATQYQVFFPNIGIAAGDSTPTLSITPSPSATPTLTSNPPPTPTPEPTATQTRPPTKTRAPSPTPEWWSTEAGRMQWSDTIQIVKQVNPQFDNNNLVRDELPDNRQILKDLIRYAGEYSDKNPIALDAEFGDKIANELPRGKDGKILPAIDPNNPLRFLDRTNVNWITLHGQGGIWFIGQNGNRIILDLDWQSDLTPNLEARKIINAAFLLKEAWVIKWLKYGIDNKIMNEQMRQTIDTSTHALAFSIIKYYSFNHPDPEVRQQLQDALNGWRTLEPWKPNGVGFVPNIQEAYLYPHDIEYIDRRIAQLEHALGGKRSPVKIAATERKLELLRQERQALLQNALLIR